MLSTHTFFSVGCPVIALLVLNSISPFAFGQETRPPQDQIDALLKAEIEQNYPLYKYRNAEVSTTLIPGTLAYQVEFKVTLSPKRDISVNVLPPSEVNHAKTELLKEQDLQERAWMLRFSLREQVTKLPADLAALPLC